MPYIETDEALPGIRALLAFRPETAVPLSQLANILLRDEQGLSRADRELIATYVSYLNDCTYCHRSHGEIACIYLDGDRQLVEQVKNDYQNAMVPARLKALLAIAGMVQQGGSLVSPEAVAQAKWHGATDRDIHDTVLIAAAFCMFNRYVDGLAANTPADLSSYPPRARQVVENGYTSQFHLGPG
jgi:uncharacterized peroxidase-related enzyme